MPLDIDKNRPIATTAHWGTYYAEVEKIKSSHLYNKFENEEIKVSKLSFNQLKKINSSAQIQNVLTKVSIYEYINKIKKDIKTVKPIFKNFLII